MVKKIFDLFKIFFLFLFKEHLLDILYDFLIHEVIEKIYIIIEFRINQSFNIIIFNIE